MLCTTKFKKLNLSIQTMKKKRQIDKGNDVHYIQLEEEEEMIKLACIVLYGSKEKLINYIKREGTVIKLSS